MNTTGFENVSQTPAEGTDSIFFFSKRMRSQTTCYFFAFNTLPVNEFLEYQNDSKVSATIFLHCSLVGATIFRATLKIIMIRESSFLFFRWKTICIIKYYTRSIRL